MDSLVILGVLVSVVASVVGGVALILYIPNRARLVATAMLILAVPLILTGHWGEGPVIFWIGICLGVAGAASWVVMVSRRFH